MGVVQIVQIVPNRATHHLYGKKCSLVLTFAAFKLFQVLFLFLLEQILLR